MAANPEKQVVELDDRVKYESWDCHHDISTHVRNKTMSLRSRDDKLSFFNSLSESFHCHNPLADPDVVHFVGDLYDSVKSQLLLLLEEDRVESRDLFDDDEAYRVFLDHTRLDGESYVLDIPEDGIFVKYESDELEDSTLPTATRSRSNSEAVRLRKPPGRKRKQLLQTNVDSNAKTRRGRESKQHLALSTVFRSSVDLEVKEEEEDHLPHLERAIIKQPEPVVNVDQWWHKLKTRAQKNTEFRDKLMDDLKRPYSEAEYQMLLKQLCEKKPVRSQRVLRSCTKSYDDDTRPAKSILDYHADLAKRIDSVRDDHPRVLNLLRGYFYWMLNLSQEGSFLPWEDATCLEVHRCQKLLILEGIDWPCTVPSPLTLLPSGPTSMLCCLSYISSPHSHAHTFSCTICYNLICITFASFCFPRFV